MFMFAFIFIKICTLCYFLAQTQFSRYSATCPSFVSTTIRDQMISGVSFIKIELVQLMFIFFSLFYIIENHTTTKQLYKLSPIYKYTEHFIEINKDVSILLYISFLVLIITNFLSTYSVKILLHAFTFYDIPNKTSQRVYTSSSVRLYENMNVVSYRFTYSSHDSIVSWKRLLFMISILHYKILPQGNLFHVQVWLFF